ncbi:MAG: phytanoyl-CoA dioxygenase family protein [Oceanospirillaceae bacterium]
MHVLTAEQKEQFWAQGYLVVEDAVDKKLLQALKDDFANWTQESREHNQPYGQTIDSRPRFDLAIGHTSEKPELRRINAPVEISQAYYNAMASSKITDCVADLIGPNIKLHHSKINSKLPGGKTQVKWHQDFPFTPHSNDDLITALLMLDDVTLENGPLEVVAGSHKEAIHGLWQNGIFSGSVNEELTKDCQQRATTCTGTAGAVCLMHTRLLHGSKPNTGKDPRTLFITVYSAEDAIPYSSNPMPSKYEGLIVRGEATNTVRSIAYAMDLPEKPTTASFFDQQAMG